VPTLIKKFRSLFHPFRRELSNVRAQHRAMFNHCGERVTNETTTFELNDLRRERLRSIGIILDIPNGTHQVPLRAAFEPPVLVSTIGHGWLPTRYGAFSYSHSSCLLNSVGRYCSIANNVQSMLPEHPSGWLSTSAFQYYEGFSIFSDYIERTGGKFDFRPFYALKRIDIGHDVWIGANAYLRGGIKVGNGAIIGASAVVTKDVPPYAIVVGNPARVVRYRFDDKTIERFQKIEWWRFDFPSLNSVNLLDADRAIDQIQVLEAKGMQPYVPKWVTMADLLELDSE
jgi:acetyltransferase-like isoleucine patch superfamily enzyme